MESKTYLRFGAMIATSTLVMFGLMYLNTYQLEHVRFSETRAWMALLMGAVMAVIMLLFMLKMYTDKRMNLAILGGAVLVFAGSLWLVRSQETVNDVDYMRAMIPHHSIAIMTSERAHIRDPRVRETGRRHHRGPKARDRRDGRPDCRSSAQPHAFYGSRSAGLHQALRPSLLCPRRTGTLNA